MVEKELDVYLNYVYVNDEDIIMEAIEKGIKWNGEQMEYREEWKNQDLVDDKEDNLRTMREMRNMVNTIEKDIQMEESVASQEESKKLPILDFQTWTDIEELEDMKKTKLRWMYYRKKIVSKYGKLPYPYP